MTKKSNQQYHYFLQPALMIVELDETHSTSGHNQKKKCCKRYKDGIQHKCKSCPKRKKK